MAAFYRLLVTDRKVSTSYQNQAINAIKFYFEKVLRGSRKLYFVSSPKKEQAFHTVCSAEKIQQILNTIENIKHKANLGKIYSARLKISELVNLPIKAIDSDRMQIRIANGKGNKRPLHHHIEKTTAPASNLFSAGKTALLAL